MNSNVLFSRSWHSLACFSLTSGYNYETCPRRYWFKATYPFDIDKKPTVMIKMWSYRCARTRVQYTCTHACTRATKHIVTQRASAKYRYAAEPWETIEAARAFDTSIPRRRWKSTLRRDVGKRWCAFERRGADRETRASPTTITKTLRCYWKTHRRHS